MFETSQWQCELTGTSYEQWGPNLFWVGSFCRDDSQNRLQLNDLNLNRRLKMRLGKAALKDLFRTHETIYL